MRTGHSKIIGRRVHAAHEVRAGIVGSRVGNRTGIILGGLPYEEFDHQLLVKEIQELEESMARNALGEEKPTRQDRHGVLPCL